MGSALNESRLKWSDREDGGAGSRQIHARFRLEFADHLTRPLVLVYSLCCGTISRTQRIKNVRSKIAPVRFPESTKFNQSTEGRIRRVSCRVDLFGSRKERLSVTNAWTFVGALQELWVARGRMWKSRLRCHFDSSGLHARPDQVQKSTSTLSS